MGARQRCRGWHARLGPTQPQKGVLVLVPGPPFPQGPPKSPPKSRGAAGCNPDKPTGSISQIKTAAPGAGGVLGASLSPDRTRGVPSPPPSPVPRPPLMGRGPQDPDVAPGEGSRVRPGLAAGLVGRQEPALSQPLPEKQQERDGGVSGTWASPIPREKGLGWPKGTGHPWVQAPGCGPSTPRASVSPLQRWP